LEEYQKSARSDLRLITYPRPEEEMSQMLQSHGASVPVTSESEQNIARQGYGQSNTPTPPRNTYDPQSATRSTYPPQTGISPQGTTTASPPSSSSTANPSPYSSTSSPPKPEPPSLQPRTFAILESPPGANPFDIGTAGNFREVMGYNVLDWVLPLKMSPLVDHSDPVGMYKLGPAVRRMRRKAGIADGGDEEEEGHGKRRGERDREHRRRKRRSTRHSRSPSGSKA